MPAATTVDGEPDRPQVRRPDRSPREEETASAPTQAKAGSRATARGSWLYRLLAHVLVPVFRVVFRLRARGAERIPAGGFVLCANQLSNVDALALAATLHPRPLRSMGKAELFTPLFGPVMRAIGSFPVHRDRVDSAAIETAVELACAGEGILIFPEGTRRAKGRGKTRVAEPHQGPAFVALLAEVPVVPAAIHGTEAITRLRPWRIAFGEPIATAEVAAMPRREARRVLTERIWSEVLGLEAGLAREEAAR
jgi:1-acyl-sn-glycerol-3-phosphate acyltransferase